jgi:hypothetical protein
MTTKCARCKKKNAVGTWTILYWRNIPLCKECGKESEANGTGRKE